jgi:hypothetical protein
MKQSLLPFRASTTIFQKLLSLAQGAPKPPAPEHIAIDDQSGCNFAVFQD